MIYNLYKLNKIGIRKYNEKLSLDFDVSNLVFRGLNQMECFWMVYGENQQLKGFSINNHLHPDFLVKCGEINTTKLSEILLNFNGKDLFNFYDFKS